MAALKPEPLGEMHDSLEGIWVPLGKKTRSISATALVHESVKQRVAGTKYAPNNLPMSVNYVAQ